MAKLVWDQTTQKRYETGIEQVALYKQVNGAYPAGVAWNGVTALNLTPSGAEPTPLYANDRKYLTLMSVEELDGTIEAYTYPDEFAECDGSKTLATGVKIGQQKRKAFGLTYRNNIGNDVEGTAYGYELHIVYGAMVSPTEKAHATINESPEPETLSWEFTTTPVDVEGFEPTSHLSFKSTDVDEAKLKALEDILYGTADEEARLPLPAEIIELFGTEVAG